MAAKPDARRRVHRLQHVVHQPAQLLVHALDGRGDLAQDRIGQRDDGKLRHHREIGKSALAVNYIAARRRQVAPPAAENARPRPPRRCKSGSRRGQITERGRQPHGSRLRPSEQAAGIIAGHRPQAGGGWSPEPWSPAPSSVPGSGMASPAPALSGSAGTSVLAPSSAAAADPQRRPARRSRTRAGWWLPGPARLSLSSCF